MVLGMLFENFKNYYILRYVIYEFLKKVLGVPQPTCLVRVHCALDFLGPVLPHGRELQEGNSRKGTTGRELLGSISPKLAHKEGLEPGSLVHSSEAATLTEGWANHPDGRKKPASRWAVTAGAKMEVTELRHAGIHSGSSNRSMQLPWLMC